MVESYSGYGCNDRSLILLRVFTVARQSLRMNPPEVLIAFVGLRRQPTVTSRLDVQAIGVGIKINLPNERERKGNAPSIIDRDQNGRG